MNNGKCKNSKALAFDAFVELTNRNLISGNNDDVDVREEEEKLVPRRMLQQ